MHLKTSTLNRPPKQTAIYLPFNGHAQDLSANKNATTLVGGTFGDGIYGKALTFNGASDKVTVTANASLVPGLTTSFSFGFWFKTAVKDVTRYFFVNEAVAGDYSYMRFTAATGAYFGRFHDTVAPFDTGISSDFSNSLPHFLVIVVDRTLGYARTYIDGYYQNQKDIAAMLAILTGGAWSIGGLAGYGWFSGTSYGFFMIKRILTANEIMALAKGLVTFS